MREQEKLLKLFNEVGGIEVLISQVQEASLRLDNLAQEQEQNKAQVGQRQSFSGSLKLENNLSFSKTQPRHSTEVQSPMLRHQTSLTGGGVNGNHLRQI